MTKKPRITCKACGEGGVDTIGRLCFQCAVDRIARLEKAEGRRIARIKYLEGVIEEQAQKLSERYCPVQTAGCTECRATVLV